MGMMAYIDLVKIMIILLTLSSNMKQPKIDEVHPTWLHLRIREFNPKFAAKQIKGSHSNMSRHGADGKWTLGFQNAEACEAAQSLILEETRRQRTEVESLLSPVLHNVWPEDVLNSHAE